MKKLFAIMLAVLMLAVSVVPVSAENQLDGAPAELVEQVYRAYTFPRWVEHIQSLGEALDTLPPNTANVYETYEEYCAAYPIESFGEYGWFKYLGSYLDDTVSVWVIQFYHVLGARQIFVGDYVLCDGCVHYGESEPGVYVYDGSQLTSLPDAYEQGIIDDSVLAGVCADNYAIGCVDKGLWRIGDLDGSNVLDVADVVEMKAYILSIKYFKPSYEEWRERADFDKNSYVDVGDIVALKAYIMSE